MLDAGCWMLDAGLRAMACIDGMQEVIQLAAKQIEALMNVLEKRFIPERFCFVKYF
jgi:hypothetical protein